MPSADTYRADAAAAAKRKAAAAAAAKRKAAAAAATRGPVQGPTAAESAAFIKSRGEGGTSGQIPATVAAARRYIGQAAFDQQCLAWVAMINGVKGQGSTTNNPNESWAQAVRGGAAHTTAPPIGSTVMWTASGRPGHTAIVSKYVNGKPYVITTGIGGKIAEVPLSYFGGSLQYKGWVSSMNGIKLDTKKMVDPGSGTSLGDLQGGTGGTRGTGGTGGSTTVINEGGSGFSVSGTGGGFSKKEFYAQLAEKFGDVQTLLRLDKEAQGTLGEGKSLKWAIDQMVKKKIVDSSIALTYLNQTAWFKKYAPEISKRIVDEEAKPERTADERKQVQANFETVLNQKGVRVSPETMASVIRDAHIYGWSTAQMIDAVQSAGNYSYDGGDIATQVQQVREFADQYGTTLNENEVRQLQTELLDGMGTQSGQDRIIETAAGKYSIYADRIRAGETVKDITKPYWDRASELLEVAPGAINWDDSLFKDGAAFTKTDATTGGVVAKTLSEFEKEVRQDARWKTTNNARQSVGNAQYSMLQRFGFVA